MNSCRGKEVCSVDKCMQTAEGKMGAVLTLFGAKVT